MKIKKEEMYLRWGYKKTPFRQMHRYITRAARKEQEEFPGKDP
jgi:hypothetical protein